MSVVLGPLVAQIGGPQAEFRAIRLAGAGDVVRRIVFHFRPQVATYVFGGGAGFVWLRGVHGKF